ncbi:hypothetical protein [Inediibacterium massiliense]|uniref:hypothetical protein n=1 Tax=Inediibacterium massiliense TaxID=1658111 RepID=UPI0006B45992|nr:hypothetical protein [Inediibacterium massiliense]
MNKSIGLFVKILLILIIFSLLLPQLIDQLARLWTIEKRGGPPSGNSTFVSGSYIEEKNFKENLYFMIKYLLK